jgi:V/A-type H+-transporting ATPase subunit I
MDDVIETVHDLNLLHVTEYDGSWDGFEPGNPIEGADDASEKLVTVRSLQSILGVDEADAGPSRLVTDDALAEELEEIRQDVNELDDRRDEIHEELRSVEEQIEQIELFATLGIDLDLLQGYDTIEVAVGEGDEDAVRRALVDADAVRVHDVFAEGKAVAAFAKLAEDSDQTLADILVGTAFSEQDVPDADGSPENYLSELQHEKQQLESKLETVEGELEDLRLEVSSFLLAAEERLSIDVQKREAPLTFATTDNAFIAEGWIPTTEFVNLVEALQEAVGDHVEVEELERAEYRGESHAHEREPIGGGTPPGEPTAADGGKEAATDGGTTMNTSEPPVIQKNPGPVRPFESLVEVINRPKYSEFDPTVILFLTYPLFFGFMIGDLGYGLIYLGLGSVLYRTAGSDMLKSLGGVAMWAGGFTALFGVLYGEIFGLHILGDVVFGDAGPPMKKGLQPANAEYAMTWMVLSLLVGLAHLTVGYVFDFIENLSHGLMDAVTESGSWVVLMIGVWGWTFSLSAKNMKPSFLFTVFDGKPFAFGFGGFSTGVGTSFLALVAVGFILLVLGEGLAGVLESLDVLVNVLSYTRIAAVLLAKAGMAFVVNLMFFGAYEHHDEFHFMMGHGPGYVESHYGGEATVMFDGLVHMGVGGILGGLVVLIAGHLLVLVLGITSAGLQAVRLEYVEFFGKFYEGGGDKYQPFGYDRNYTTEN